MPRYPSTVIPYSQFRKQQVYYKPKNKKYTRVAAPRRRGGRTYNKRSSNSIGGTIGTAAGTIATPFLAPYLGPAAALAPALGGIIGRGAQSIMKSITGYGDYKVNVNSLISSDPVPEFQNQSQRSTMVKHREFITDVVGNSGGTFNLNSFFINPGNANLFPWLSQIAQNYEQYRFHGLIFEYKTTSGAISTTPVLGTVVMATQYNSLSTAFTNKQQMENYEFAGSIVPSQNLIHPIECDPKETQCNGIFNVSTNTNLQGGDSRLFYMGNFNIATVGLPTSVETCGELWVSYDCCLMKPRLNPAGAGKADHWFGTGTGFDGSTNWFGTDIALTSNSDNFTVIATTSASATITFAPSFYGNIQITYEIVQSGAVAAPQAPTFAGSNGASNLNIFKGKTVQAVRPVGGSAATNILGAYCYSIQPLGNGTVPTITLTSGSFSTVSNVDVLIEQIPTNFT